MKLKVSTFYTIILLFAAVSSVLGAPKKSGGWGGSKSSWGSKSSSKSKGVFGGIFGSKKNKLGKINWKLDGG